MKLDCHDVSGFLPQVMAKGDTMHSWPTDAANGPHKLDFIGDHLAINFINTFRIEQGEPFDVFQTDEDVRDWMVRLDVPVHLGMESWPRGTLLRKARQLREIALKAVQAKKAEKRPSLNALNSFLEHSTSYPQVVTLARGKIEVKKNYSGRGAEGFLAPIAESVADLLANGDFELVRSCEGEECVLWFYDRTKAHRRRWCSSTVCGNRAKVAAFRARSHAHAK